MAATCYCAAMRTTGLLAVLLLALLTACKSGTATGPVTAPPAPADLDSPERAERAKGLARSCMACHSEGNGFRAPVIGKPLPRTGRDPAAIFETIRNGVPGTSMVGRSLPDDVVWDLVSWVRAQTPEGPGADKAAAPVEGTDSAER